MRNDGVVTRWEDSRGFGFITPTTGGPQVFLHVSETRGRRPEVGDALTYLTTWDDRGRIRASDVTFTTTSRSRTRIDRTSAAAGVVALAFLGLLAVLAALGFLPWLLVAFSAAMSVMAFALYRADKAAATKGAWRISESQLQLVSMLGGWPGALLAQRVYHHKTRKQSFQLLFWITVIVNCVALVWIALGRPLPI